MEKFICGFVTFGFGDAALNQRVAMRRTLSAVGAAIAGSGLLVGAVQMSATAATSSATVLPTTSVIKPNTCPAPCVSVAANSAVGSDDTSRLQTAVDQVGAGGTVLLSAGTFVLSRPLRVPATTRLAGVGSKLTTLTMKSGAWSNFGYSYLVMPKTIGPGQSTGVVVQDITINGGRTPGPGIAPPVMPPENSGGGIRLGDNWTVTRSRFTNLNYFNVWLEDVSNVSVTSCTFDDLAGDSFGNDLIGGGGVRGATVKGNTVHATATGNSLDLLRSTGISYQNNKVGGSVGKQHGVYFEGVTSSTISGNTLTASSISVQSDSQYSSTTAATNPRAVTVSGNVIQNPPEQGISVRYDTHVGGQSTGGGNIIKNNQVTGAGTAGVVIFAAANGLVSQGDQIIANTVTEPFSNGQAEWNMGYGITRSAGIVVGVGAGTRINYNKVVDTAANGSISHGIELGLRSGGNVPVVVSSLVGNTASGVTGETIYRVPGT